MPRNCIEIDVDKELYPHPDTVKFFLHKKTGLVFVYDGSIGSLSTIHPSIEISGCLRSMKKDYWGKNAIIIKAMGCYYNVSKRVIEDKYEKIASKYCKCLGCKGVKNVN